MSSNLAVAIRPVLLNALNVVNDVPAPEDANLEKLANRLLEIMFAVPEQNVTVPVVAEEKPKKARKSKKTEEPAAPEVPAPEPAAPAEAKPKKSRAKKAAEAPLPASDAEAPAPAEKPKKAKKEKAVGVNIEKLTPTQMKLLKPIADELKVEVDKAKFLEQLNALSADVYAAKTIYDHFRDFSGVAAPVAEPEERESIVVDFQGKTYYVTPEDKKVWEEGDDGVHKFVGHVGMAAFADLKVPEL